MNTTVWLTGNFAKNTWMLEPDAYSYAVRENGHKLFNYVGQLVVENGNSINIGEQSILTYYNLPNYILVSITGLSYQLGEQSKVGMGLVVNNTKSLQDYTIGKGYRVEVTSDQSTLPIGAKYKKYYENGQIVLKTTGETEDLDGGVVGNGGEVEWGDDVNVEGNQIFIEKIEVYGETLTIHYNPDTFTFDKKLIDEVTAICDQVDKSEFTEKMPDITYEVAPFTQASNNITEQVTTDMADSV